VKTGVLHSDQDNLPTVFIDPDNKSLMVRDASQSDMPLGTHVPIDGLVPQKYLSIDDFQKIGMSIADWAHAHHFNVRLVYSVVRGERKCLRGESYQIAKELGMK